MTKDAKLALVIGIGVVIVIAVVFFRKEPTPAKAASEPTAAAVKPKGVSVTPGALAAPKPGVKHTVSPGETLFSLAEHYYQDSGRFVDIYQANRELLQNPQQLTPGTVIVIPGVEAQ
jgi:nucleoid-associated protein YgaU